MLNFYFQYQQSLVFDFLVMAYVFKLPQTVTEEIMMCAIGYPRDRLRALAADVVRTEIHFFLEGRAKYMVSWLTAGPGGNWLEGGFRIIWYNEPLLSFWAASLARDNGKKMRLLQKQYEPCEPTDLELQRMQF